MTQATAEKYIKDNHILPFCGNLQTYSKQLIEKSYIKMRYSSKQLAYLVRQQFPAVLNILLLKLHCFSLSKL